MEMAILDGGVGHLIKQRGVGIEGLSYEHQFVAGVVANVEKPEVIEDIHRQYLQAGSNVITTNSFSATEYALKKINWHHRTVELIQAWSLVFKAMRLAMCAIGSMHMCKKSNCNRKQQCTCGWICSTVEREVSASCLGVYAH